MRFRVDHLCSTRSLFVVQAAVCASRCFTRTQITHDGASVHCRQHNHPTAARLMTCLSENLEKQARLLSSKLVQSDRWVEVVINPAVLAWKEFEKEEKSSHVSSFSKTGKSEKRRSNSMSHGWEINTDKEHFEHKKKLTVIQKENHISAAINSLDLSFKCNIFLAKSEAAVCSLTVACTRWGGATESGHVVPPCWQGRVTQVCSPQSEHLFRTVRRVPAGIRSHLLSWFINRVLHLTVLKGNT